MATDLEEHFERLGWVRNELGTLETEITRYLEDKPYEIRWHYDFSKNPPTRLYYPVQKADPPKGAQIRTGTLINELRSILDAMACTLAQRNGHSEKEVSDVYFPTARSARAYAADKRVRNKIRKLSPADQSLIDSLQPYPGGNDLLYTLHSTDVLRKHQRLVLFANALSGFRLLKGSLDGSKFGRLGFAPGPIADRPIIAEHAHDYEQPIELVLAVTFAEPDWIKGEPITTTLNNFASEVQAALELFN